MMKLSELSRVVGGEWHGQDVEFLVVGSDSRGIQHGQLFVALKGERFDGHAFAQQALDNGAAAVMVSDPGLPVRPRVLVTDTRKALGQLAAFWRQTMPAKLVAVTGSNGKTTTKEMLAAIFAAACGTTADVHATQGNFNNHIGLPLTLLKIKPHHRFVVAEMGMNHLGEIAYLTEMAKPEVAVISNAGTAHIGELGSRENIAKAKGEIFSGLGPRGVAVINADDVFCAYWQGLNAGREIITFAMQRAADVTAKYVKNSGISVVKFTTPQGEFDVQLKVLGLHNVYNALAACASAVAVGVANPAIAQGLTDFSGVSGRLQLKQGLRGATLIDDTYNANPDSMKAAIDVLVSQSASHVMVVGDMGELGDDAVEMHAEIGQYARDKGVRGFLALGPLSQHAVEAFGTGALHFETLEALIAHVKTLMHEQAVVLIKGSRFMQMERVVQALEQNQDNTGGG